MEASDGRKMFIDIAARPAASTSVAICGAVVRSRKRTCRKSVSFRLVVAGGAVSPGRDMVDRRLCGPAALVLAVEGVEAGGDDGHGDDISGSGEHVVGEKSVGRGRLR